MNEGLGELRVSQTLFYGEDLAERLRCHEVAAKDINLTARLLKK